MISLSKPKQTLEQISLTLQNVLCQDSSRDYRFILVLALGLYFLLIGIGSLFAHYEVVWQTLFHVPALSPAFADLRVLTSGFECARQGYDVTVENPCDPWGRPSPYPRLWWLLAGTGISQAHTVAIGVIMALLLYFLVYNFIGRLNLVQSLFYSLFICSPTAMLLVERGNNDIFIFYLFILVLWLLTSQKFILRLLSYGLVYFAMMLKLFPVFGFTIILRERPKRFWLLAATIVVAVALYVGFFSEELAIITGTSRMAEDTPTLTYGPKILFFQLSQPEHLTREIINVIAFLGFLPILVSIIRESERVFKRVPFSDECPQLDAFRLGASIYVATALVSVSWDYRLFFIILTFPQLLSLISQKQSFLSAPFFALLAALSTMYLSSISILDEFANGVLLVLYGYLLLKTLPNWMKQIWSQLYSGIVRV